MAVMNERAGFDRRSGKDRRCGAERRKDSFAVRLDRRMISNRRSDPGDRRCGKDRRLGWK